MSASESSRTRSTSLARSQQSDRSTSSQSALFRNSNNHAYTHFSSPTPAVHLLNNISQSVSQISHQVPSKPLPQVKLHSQMETQSKQSDGRKLPSFSTTALNINIPTISVSSSTPNPSAPPSRSLSATSQNTVTDHVSQTKLLHWLRVPVSVLIIGLAGAIIGLNAHSLYLYNATHLSSGWFLPLWPADMDLRPTITAITGPGVAALAALVYLIVAIIPTPRSKARLEHYVFTVTTFLGIAGSVVALVFNTALPSSFPFSDLTTSSTAITIASWTCHISNSVSSYTSSSAMTKLTSQTPTVSPQLLKAPYGFSSVCSEVRASWGLLVGLVALEIVAGLVLIAWGTWVGWQVNQSLKKDGQGEKEKSGLGAIRSRMSW